MGLIWNLRTQTDGQLDRLNITMQTKFNNQSKRKLNDKKGNTDEYNDVNIKKYQNS